MLTHLKKAWESIQNSNTLVRWALVVGVFFALMLVSGFQIQEFRVSLLLLWYGVLSCALSSFFTYTYGKVNYHKASTDSEIIGQAIIFVGTLIFSGLVILGTYIAQYH